MAAATRSGPARRVGLPFGAPDHPARTRQRLEMVYCTQAADGRTRMGDVSDHAAHPCQSLPTGWYRSKARCRSARPRFRALCVALASFGWISLLIERLRNREIHAHGTTALA